MARRRSPGYGSVYPVKSGGWVAAITTGHTLDGKQKRKTHRVRTKTEGLRWLAQEKVRMDAGGGTTQESITVRSYLDQWLESDIRPRRSDSTYETYRRFVVNHLQPGLGHHRLTKLSPRHVRDFLNAKLASGETPHNVNYMRRVLTTALGRAVRDEVVARNVASLADTLPTDAFEGWPFTADEARRFLVAIKGERLETLFFTAISLGLRLGECQGLRWSDVDFGEGTISIRFQVKNQHGIVTFGPLKTVSSRRMLPMPDWVAASLAHHRRRMLEDRLLAGRRWVDLDLVFPSTIGTPFSESTVYAAFARILERGDILAVRERDQQPRRFHDLRHSTATLLGTMRVPDKIVQAILGHATIATTLDTYTHADIGGMRAALEQFGTFTEADKWSS